MNKNKRTSHKTGENRGNELYCHLTKARLELSKDLMKKFGHRLVYLDERKLTALSLNKCIPFYVDKIITPANLVDLGKLIREGKLLLRDYKSEIADIVAENLDKLRSQITPDELNSIGDVRNENLTIDDVFVFATCEDNEISISSNLEKGKTVENIFIINANCRNLENQCWVLEVIKFLKNSSKDSFSSKNNLKKSRLKASSFLSSSTSKSLAKVIVGLLQSIPSGKTISLILRNYGCSLSLCPGEKYNKETGVFCGSEIGSLDFSNNGNNRKNLELANIINLMTNHCVANQAHSINLHVLICSKIVKENQLNQITSV